MNLHLDHVQRLNLVALLDTLEVPGRREAHAICKLQDVLDLDQEEREAIRLEQVNMNGNQGYRWDASVNLPPKQYDLAPADIERITKALDTARIVLVRDRWFRSLNAQLPEPVESNGSTGKEAGGQ